MKFVYSVLGLVAQANSQLARQSINFVPTNIILIGVSLILAVTAFGIGVGDKNPLALLGIFPCLLVAGLFIASTLKNNVFFMRDSNPTATTVGSTSDDVAFQTPIAFTGKFRLDEKTERRFLNIPASITRLGGGELAFASRIDASSRMYGITTKSRVGVWVSLPGLQNMAIENGTLLHGSKPAPALRLQYEENSGAKPKRATTVLSFENNADRDTMRAFLQSQSSSNSPFSNG